MTLVNKQMGSFWHCNHLDDCIGQMHRKELPLYLPVPEACSYGINLCEAFKICGIESNSVILLPVDKMDKALKFAHSGNNLISNLIGLFVSLENLWYLRGTDQGALVSCA